METPLPVPWLQLASLGTREFLPAAAALCVSGSLGLVHMVVLTQT